MIVTLSALFATPPVPLDPRRPGSFTVWDGQTRGFLDVVLPSRPAGSVTQFCFTTRFFSSNQFPSGLSPVEEFTTAFQSRADVRLLPAADLPIVAFPEGAFPFHDRREETLAMGRPDPLVHVDRQVREAMHGLGCDGLVVSELSESSWSIQVYTHGTIARGSSAQLSSADYLGDPDWTAVGQRVGRALTDLALHRSPVQRSQPEPGEAVVAPRRWCDEAPPGKVCAVKTEDGVVVLQHDQLRFVPEFEVPDLFESLHEWMSFIDPIDEAVPFMDAPGRHMRLGTFPGGVGTGRVWIHHDRRLILLGYGSPVNDREIRLPEGSWVQNGDDWLHVGVPGKDGTVVHAIDFQKRAGPWWLAR